MSCEASVVAPPEEAGCPQWVPQPDVAARARELGERFERAYGRAPAGVWAAPGRANLMGEYIDFSGGMCLPFAHQYVTLTAAAPRTDGVLRALSLQDADESVADHRLRETRVGQIAPGGISGWFGYAAGVAWGMNRVAAGASAHPVAVPELALPAEFGADLMVDSTVPIGAGLASSAALECSVALALHSLHTGEDDPDDAHRRALARACMDAENYIVGANTGGLDQTASLRSHAGEMIALDCRDFDATHLPADPSAAGLTWLAVDTRAPHRLADGQYSSRRDECEAAAAVLGVARLRDALPEHPTEDDAAAVLERFDDLVSSGVTLRGNPEGVRLRLRHSLTEMVRSVRIADQLSSPDPDWSLVGRLLVAGHESMRRDCQVTVPELDTAVTACLAAGALGAKVVGGGFGGSVIALAREDALDELADSVCSAFSDHGFRDPLFLTLNPSPAGRRVR
ncbi:galactokinase [Kocuria tytonicola]|uniref:galactokinase n=1 Tax=Kocuria tytonicola TaxID=2055946 RepID=UPI000EF8A6EC|nr:galactokinase family protein [Kocuria tytonicola]RLZ04413.1 galactokinase [Kocuria tytonicola]